MSNETEWERNQRLNKRRDMVDDDFFYLGCILLPISFAILGFGIWLMTQGLILIGFGFLCVSGIINWGLPALQKWLGGSDETK